MKVCSCSNQGYGNVVFTGKHLYNEVYNMYGTLNLCQVLAGSQRFKKNARKDLS